MSHPHDRIVNLAHSFPVLEPYLARAHIKTGIDWDPQGLDEAVVNAGDGAKHAAAFILHLWNCEGRWLVGRFVLSRAVACWDSQQLAAFQAWARECWLP